jgi:hypothetical protein
MARGRWQSNERCSKKQFGNSSPFSQLTERVSFLTHAIDHSAFEWRDTIDDAQDGARKNQLNLIFRDRLVHNVERRLYRAKAVVDHVSFVAMQPPGRPRTPTHPRHPHSGRYLGSLAQDEARSIAGNDAKFPVFIGASWK